MNIINVKQGTEEWRQMRYHYICASDVAALLEEDRYKDILDVFLEKFLKREKENGYNSHFEIGHQFEAKVRESYEHKRNMKFEPIVVTNDSELHMLASLDGFHKETNTVLECKTMPMEDMQKIKKIEDVPKYHMWQIQAQLMVTEATKCLYVVGARENFDEQITHEIYPNGTYKRRIRAAIVRFKKRFDEVREKYENSKNA